MLKNQKKIHEHLNRLIDKITYQFSVYRASLKDGVPYSILKSSWQRIMSTEQEIAQVAGQLELLNTSSIAK